MARNTTPAPEIKEVPANEVVIAEEFNAANQLALAQRESDERARAVAKQLGYLLPADATDPDLIQRDIAANMRRSVEACLEVGRGLTVLKAACGHGEFGMRLGVLGIDKPVASRFMLAASRFSNLPTSANLTKAIGNQSKLFELLVLDADEVEELAAGGEVHGLDADDIAGMTIKELRAALREAKAEKEASDKLLENKNKQIDKLEREKQRIAQMAPDEALADLKTAATRIANDAVGAIQGGVRQALIKLRELPQGTSQTAFAAGLLGELQAEINALREEFGLPDIASAAERQLAADTQAWAGGGEAVEA
ncbi:hypothetical protein [Comamonas testosteroni]|uniref:hypothetical protein n=1 Tax=Comamonas testosteroni TaxID=285 RepID=UPI0026F2E76B|nr:hypothetical protein [Comamonas testosteroni]